MVIKNNSAIDSRIVEMRTDKFGLFRIHKWLVGWGDFSQLDEIVVLAHILGVLNEQNLAVTRNEVKYCFNKFYRKDFHGDKRSYLTWLYKQFKVRQGSVVSVERSHRVLNEDNKGCGAKILVQTSNCLGGKK